MNGFVTFWRDKRTLKGVEKGEEEVKRKIKTK